MMRSESLGRREILWRVGAVVGLAAAGRVPGVLRVVSAAEATAEKDYVGFFGKFSRTPFVVIEKPKGAAVKIKPAFGLRQMNIDVQ